jgi:hypothetical protein
MASAALLSGSGVSLDEPIAEIRGMRMEIPDCESGLCWPDRRFKRFTLWYGLFCNLLIIGLLKLSARFENIVGGGCRLARENFCRGRGFLPFLPVHSSLLLFHSMHERTIILGIVFEE